MIDMPRGVATHEPAQCAGSYCCLHNPSSHHMVDWPVNFRMDLIPVLVERLCTHGVGHPDPDSLKWVTTQVFETFEGDEKQEELYDTLGIHGCCGNLCCAPPKGDHGSRHVV